jgi:hypothetical protein
LSIHTTPVKLATSKAGVVELSPVTAIEELVQKLNRGFFECRLLAAMLMSHMAAKQFGHAQDCPDLTAADLLGSTFAQDSSSTSVDSRGRQMMM